MVLETVSLHSALKKILCPDFVKIEQAFLSNELPLSFINIKKTFLYVQFLDDSEK